MASNEQAAPRAKELQVIVESLQTAIQQNKAEVCRYKAQVYKAEQQLAKVVLSNVVDISRSRGSHGFGRPCLLDPGGEAG